MIYAFKSGSYIPASVDPAAAYTRIARLREEGLSTPGDIVDDARPEDSPLHDAFTWADDEAAEKYRLQEARHLCNSIIIIRDEAPESLGAPAFVSVVDHRTFDRTYVTTIEAYSDEEYRLQMLADAKSGLLAWRHRYHQLDKELGRIFAVIDEAEYGE